MNIYYRTYEKLKSYAAFRGWELVKGYYINNSSGEDDYLDEKKFINNIGGIKYITVKYKKDKDFYYI